MLFVEAELKHKTLYIDHLKTGEPELWERSDALRVDSNQQWDHIMEAVTDLRAKYGL